MHRFGRWWSDAEHALTERALELVGNTEVHVLIRPRPGGFHYTKDETSLMCRDIELVRTPGVTGLVAGTLTDSGNAATADCAAFIGAAAVIQTCATRKVVAARQNSAGPQLRS
jgi:copper homeostasis protein